MYFMADFTVGTMGDLVGFAECVHSDLNALADIYHRPQIFEHEYHFRPQRA